MNQLDHPQALDHNDHELRTRTSHDAQRPSIDPAHAAQYDASRDQSGWYMPSPIFASPIMPSLSPRPDEHAVDFTQSPNPRLSCPMDRNALGLTLADAHNNAYDEEHRNTAASPTSSASSLDWSPAPPTPGLIPSQTPFSFDMVQLEAESVLKPPAYQPSSKRESLDEFSSPTVQYVNRHVKNTSSPCKPRMRSQSSGASIKPVQRNVLSQTPLMLASTVGRRRRILLYIVLVVASWAAWTLSRNFMSKSIRIARFDNVAVKSSSAAHNLTKVASPKIPSPKSEKIKAAMARQVDRAARAAAEKAKKLAPLMPIEGVSRRYRYGANFQPSTEEGVAGKEWETTNAKLSKALEPELLHEAGKKLYLETEAQWRDYVWVAPPVHESLLRWEAKLESWEQNTRETIWQFREWSAKGRSLGLSNPVSNTADVASATFERRSDANRMPGEGIDMSSNSAPEYKLARMVVAASGSLTKWAELIQEEDALLQGKSSAAQSCGQGAEGWMQSYAQMHRSATLGKTDGRFLTYICETGSNCGGLGDRLLGMASGFLFALVTGRAFHAEWQSPVPIDVIFDAQHVDWSFSSFTTETHPVFGRPELVQQAKELDIIHFNAESMDKVFGSREWDAPVVQGKLTKGMEARDLAFASPWMKFFSNRGMVYRSFSYKKVQDRLRDLDLKPHSAFSCLINYLFTPKPEARQFINAYTSVFSLPSVFSIGIQVRTGDMSMKDPTYDLQNTIEQHKDYFQCADQLAQTYAMPNQKVLYYLVTDSNHLRQEAIKTFGDKVVISGLGIQHVHQKTGNGDGVHNAVVEEWMLAKTDYRIITQDSGFGKLASFSAGKLGSTVTIFPSMNLDVLPLKGKKARTRVDCRLESAFVTFDELASEWSLG